MTSTSISDLRPRETILGVPVDIVSRADTSAWIRNRLSAGKSCAHIVTLNPEYVMTCRRDAAFHTIVQEADLVTIDGAGVAIAVRWLTQIRSVERVTGVEICWIAASISAESGAGIFLLGAGPGVADRSAEKMLKVSPGAVIAGTWAEGSPHQRDDAETIRRITASGANVVLVAYGAPGQVHWIARNQSALSGAGVKVVVGIGGALDYISGNVSLAPALVRKLGLEWAYRLAREPWRWRRQLVLPQFALLVLRDALLQRVGRATSHVE
ncbi:MAG TPA: WecB/TagA/CpsF family glycosyltransferase [Thermomicrobiales bacterium]|nr:WecB/TagA/CpsF family glycosyltransferase [Thermomicrobiales bacterium]